MSEFRTSCWGPLLLFGFVGVSAWAGFVVYATNQERLSSPVVRQILATLRADNEVKEVLGDTIRPEPAWYLNGDPWINGAVRGTILRLRDMLISHCMLRSTSFKGV